MINLPHPNPGPPTHPAPFIKDSRNKTPEDLFDDSDDIRDESCRDRVEEVTAAAVAWQAAEAIRTVNRRTLFPDDSRGYRYPADVDSMIGALLVLAQRLPQTLGQADRWLRAAHDADRVDHDRRHAAKSLASSGAVRLDVVAEAVEGVLEALDRAGNAAAALARALNDARRDSCHLTGTAPSAVPGPGDRARVRVGVGVGVGLEPDPQADPTGTQQPSSSAQKAVTDQSRQTPSGGFPWGRNVPLAPRTPPGAIGMPNPATRSARWDPVLRVQYQVTGRDLTLLGWLTDHGVLTTPQIAHALYPSLDYAQRRLLTLTRAGLVDRFRPQRPDGGTFPYHYVIAQLGLDVISGQRCDDEPPRRDAARRRRVQLTSRANLPHKLAVNQFFIDLAGHARTHPGTRLERWWSSARCQQPGTWAGLDGTPATDARLWHLTIAADGHGVWIDTTPDHPSGGCVPFFVEVDLGTEDLSRLVGKLTAYARWSRTTGRTWPVLFWLGSTVRERHLHDHLGARPTSVPVATATRDHTSSHPADPATPVWWLHLAEHWLPGPARPGRLTLADLAPTITGPPLTTGPGARPLRPEGVINDPTTPPWGTAS